MTDERYSRQDGLLPVARLQEIRIAIAGVGAVGRQVALQLASAGAMNIVMFDHDTVETVNLGPQGWSPRDIGKYKVDALKQDMSRCLADGEPENWQAKACRFPLILGEDADVLFCCVDGIQTRRRIFEAHGHKVKLFLDSRVAADVVHVLSVADKEQAGYYGTTFFSDNEVFRGSCTTKMSINIANIAAGLLVQQLSKWLRGMPLDRHMMFNFLSMEAFCK